MIVIRMALTPASDLVERQFRPDRPNVLWVADITYLRSGEVGCYLAAVQDDYSWRIVGWSMGAILAAARLLFSGRWPTMVASSDTAHCTVCTFPLGHGRGYSLLVSEWGVGCVEGGDP
jgi:hypothetical protein